MDISGTHRCFICDEDNGWFVPLNDGPIDREAFPEGWIAGTAVAIGRKPSDNGPVPIFEVTYICPNCHNANRLCCDG